MSSKLRVNIISCIIVSVISRTTIFCFHKDYLAIKVSHNISHFISFPKIFTLNHTMKLGSMRIIIAYLHTWKLLKIEMTQSINEDQSTNRNLKVTSTTKRKLLKMCHMRHRSRIFLFHRKVMFFSQDIQVFVFSTTIWFTKSVTSWWILVSETGCSFEHIFWTAAH